MSKNKEKNSASYYGGMTYKEFRNANKNGLQLNDIAWAGRLYSKMSYWNKKLNTFIWVCLVLCVLALVSLWVSVVLRKPALLLGVYPNGEIVCFPRLRDLKGHEVLIDQAYKGLCDSIDARVGKKWQVENLEKVSDQQAIGNTNVHQDYRKIRDLETEHAQRRSGVNPLGTSSLSSTSIESASSVSNTVSPSSTVTPPNNNVPLSPSL